MNNKEKEEFKESLHVFIGVVIVLAFAFSIAYLLLLVFK